MKRLIALILALSFVLTGCGNHVETVHTEEKQPIPVADEKQPESAQSETSAETGFIPDVKRDEIVDLNFSGMNDTELGQYVQDSVYSDLVAELNSDDYYVENVEVRYISQEYLDDLAYNSQANIYFGYTLEQLDAQFEGKKYIFTLGDDGKTIAKEFEAFEDNTYSEVLENVAVGTGVILVCVTVSVATAGAAPAISMIFAASAQTATSFALSSSVFSAASAAIVTGYQTQSFEEAIQAAALAGSEGFKWGAITGAIAGGAKETSALRKATSNGLSMNDAARIQKESGYPLDVIKQFKRMDEYQIYKEAGLKTKMVDGKLALIREIDLSFESELNGETVTNLQRMMKGYAPLDSKTEKAFQLHHVNQDPNGTLAILTEAEHQGNSAILNIFGKASEINRAEFDKIRRKFWIALAEQLA